MRSLSLFYKLPEVSRDFKHYPDNRTAHKIHNIIETYSRAELLNGITAREY